MKKQEWYLADEIKQWVKRRCEIFGFARWDRFTTDDECMSVYGWIPNGDKFDFIILYFYRDASLSFDTSSSKYSKIIHKIIFGSGAGHTNCKRVESFFDVENSIKLK